MMNTKQLKTIIIDSLKSVEDSFGELEKSTKTHLETTERLFVQRVETIENRLVEQMNATLAELNRRVHSINEIKDLNESLIFNLNTSMAELNSKVDNLVKK